MTKFNLALWNEKLSIKENADKIGLVYNYAAELARMHGLGHKRSKLKFMVKVFPPVSCEYSVTDISRSLDKLKPQQDSFFMGEGPD